jgi:phage tail-like protein
MAARTGDPFPNNRFRVAIDGMPDSDFAEVVLPEARAEVIEHREGGERLSHKVVGTLHIGNLVLRRGVTASNHLFEWWKNVADGVPDRRNVTVTLLDQQLQPVRKWQMTGVWPARFTVSPFLADGDATPLFETVECAVESLTEE